MKRSTRARGLIGLLAVLAVSGLAVATARELPRREPERKTTGCEAMGEGFVKLEGTETCIRLGGSVRSEFSTTSGGSVFLPSGSGR